jgi:hypothetical protein
MPIKPLFDLKSTHILQIILKKKERRGEENAEYLLV